MKTLLLHYKSYLVTLIVGLLLILNFTSCDPNKTDDLAGLIGGGDGTIPGTNDGLGSDGSEFYVAIDKTINSRAHVRTSGSFETKCSIAKSSTSSQDLSCIIDVPEGDLYAQGLSLIYNVPEGMCRYLNRYPYYFWTQEVGYGPSFLSVNVYSQVTTVSGSSTTVYRARPDCIITTGDGNLVSDTNCDSESAIEIALNYDAAGSISPKCIYDLSNPSNSAPNCCFGTKNLYVYDVVSKTTDGSPLTNETVLRGKVENANWGGSEGACIGGPGKTNWDRKTKNGLPTGLFIDTEKGLNSKYKVSPAHEILNLGDSSSFYSTHVANYYLSTASGTHKHRGFLASGTTTTLPYAVYPVDDRDGSPVFSTNPAYIYECRDAAWEMKHRISVYVRDWDTLADYTNYIESKGVVVRPDRLFDSEPSSTCEGLAGPCNDMLDLDDIVLMTLNGVSYTTTSASATSRRSYFPNLVY